MAQREPLAARLAKQEKVVEVAAQKDAALTMAEAEGERAVWARV